MVCEFSVEGPGGVYWVGVEIGRVAFGIWLSRFDSELLFSIILFTSTLRVFTASIVGWLVIVAAWRRDYKRSIRAKRSFGTSTWTGVCSSRRVRKSATGFCLASHTAEMEFCPFSESDSSLLVDISRPWGNSVTSSRCNNLGASGSWWRFYRAILEGVSRFLSVSSHVEIRGLARIVLWGEPNWW